MASADSKGVLKLSELIAMGVGHDRWKGYVLKNDGDIGRDGNRRYSRLLPEEFAQ